MVIRIWLSSYVSSIIPATTKGNKLTGTRGSSYFLYRENHLEEEHTEAQANQQSTSGLHCSFWTSRKLHLHGIQSLIEQRPNLPITNKMLELQVRSVLWHMFATADEKEDPLERSGFPFSLLKNELNIEDLSLVRYKFI